MNKIKKIGLIMSSINSSAATELYNGICNTARQLGYNVYVCQLHTNSKVYDINHSGQYHMFDIFDYESFDGFIASLNTINHDETRERMQEILDNTKVPVIAIDCNIKNGICIETKNYIAERQIVEHLINEHNCTKINYLSGPKENEESQERLKAYVDVMSEHGIYQPERVFEGNFFVDCGKRAIDYYDSNDVAKDYEAIVCGNDLEAISIYEELIKIGKKIPDDVIVTGFDNIEEAVIFYPLLTTVSKSTYNVGEKAVKLLKKCFSGNKVSDKIFIEPKVCIRESCGCRVSRKSIYKKSNAKLAEFTERLMIRSEFNKFIQNCMDAENFDDYVSKVKSYISYINPDAFELCIYGDCTEDFHIKGLLNVGDDRYRLGTNYNDTYLAVSYVSDKYHEDGNQHVFTPLQYRGKQFGYVMFVNSNLPFWGDAYWEFVSGLSNTLNSLKERIELNTLYMCDSLTGLYNRFGMRHYWEILTNSAIDEGTDICLMLLDMDGLKKINDVYGHEDGDFAISKIAEVLKSISSNNIVCARFGGDEFVAFSKGMTEKEFYNLVHNGIEETAANVDKPYKIGASIGTVLKTYDDTRTMDELLKIADERMYAEKTRKKMQRTD